MDIRDYLNQEIHRMSERFLADHKLLLSLPKEPIEAIDLDLLLSSYRQIVEINYCVNLYRTLFREPGDEPPHELGKFLDNIEGVLTTTLEAAALMAKKKDN